MTKPDEQTASESRPALYVLEEEHGVQVPPSAPKPVSREMLKLDFITKRRVLVAGLVVLAALAYVLATALPMGILGQQEEEGDAGADGVQELTTRGFLETMLYADGWDEEASTPAVLCVRREDGSPVLFHAIRPNMREIVELEAGTYRVEIVSPVNAGGGIYRVPEAQTVELAIGHTVNIAATLEPIAAEDAQGDDYLAIIAVFDEALTVGDASLQGEAWELLHARLMANAESSPTYVAPAPQWDYYYPYYDYSWVPQYGDSDEDDEDGLDEDDGAEGADDADGAEGADELDDGLDSYDEGIDEGFPEVLPGEDEEFAPDYEA